MLWIFHVFAIVFILLGCSVSFLIGTGADDVAIISQAWRHFKTICKHKHYVFKECRACGITLQGIIHDLSKFSPAEFLPAARYFQGNRSPIEAEKEALGYSDSWLHHKGRNKHHWEYWCDYDNTGEVLPHKIPYKYVVEMICDWIGAGKAYSKEKWTQHEPLIYYNKVRAGRHFHPQTEMQILIFLKTINEKGLDEFHRIARNGESYAYYC